MNIQEILQQKENEIRLAELDYQAERQALMDKIAQAEKRRDEKVLKLSAERNELAMKEKLKAYPAELVNNHKTCSICGAEMRPFNYVVDDKVLKAWACQAGNLQPSHDLVRV